MAIEVLMPKLGLTMTEGTIVRWLATEGQPVVAGTVLFEVENDKAVHEIEAQASGNMGPILAGEGETIPIGRVIALILSPGETIPDSSSLSKADRMSSVESSSDDRPKPIKHQQKAEILASPIAKRLAKEKGIDLATVKGSGPGGRISEADVIAAYEASGTPTGSGAPEIGQKVAFQGLRRVIAERMVNSLQGSAQLTLCREVDATELVRWRNELNSGSSDRDRISYNAILIYLATRALSEFPEINCRLEGDKIIQYKSVNIGLAIDTERGLYVPVVRNAEKKSVKEISSEITQLIEKVRHNRATEADLSNGTFTITNLGGHGVDIFTPILNPPESGILGVGRIVRKPVVLGDTDEIVIRHMLNLCITFDHRLIDGAPAASFLARVAELIEAIS